MLKFSRHWDVCSGACVLRGTYGYSDWPVRTRVHGGDNKLKTHHDVAISSPTLSIDSHRDFVTKTELIILKCLDLKIFKSLF